MTEIDTLQQLGTPAAQLKLVERGNTPGALPAAKSILWVSQDAMYTLRWSAGGIIGVAVAGQDGKPCLLMDLHRQKIGTQQLHSASKNSALGDYIVPAEVWPDARLNVKTAVASSSISEALARPGDGCSLLLYGPDTDVEMSSTNCRQLTVELCLQSSESQPENRMPAVLPAIEPENNDAPAKSPVQDLSRGRNQRVMSPGMKALSPSMKASAQITPQKSKVVTISEAKVVQNSSQAKAVLKLFADAGTAGLSSSPLQGVLSALVKRHLDSRLLLPGNVFVLPLLGSKALLRVTDMTPLSASFWQASIGTSTQVVFQGDGSRADAPSSNQYADAAAAAAAEEEVGANEDSFAAKAAFQAAVAGQKSLGFTYADLGGTSVEVATLHELVTVPLRANSIFSRYHIAPPRGIMLHGPPGTGKTALARAAATESGAKLFVINGPDVVSEYFGESEQGLKGIFAAARALAPSVIFLDEIDAVAPARKASSGVSSRLVTTLLTELDRLQGFPVIVIAATNRLDAVDPALRRPGRFDRELEVAVPSPAARREILQVLTSNMGCCRLSSHQMADIADAAHGFVGADLEAMCSQAALSCLRRTATNTAEDFYVEQQDFAIAAASVKPSGLREVALEMPKVQWKDVGGLDDVKQQLKEAVELPFRAPAALERLGAAPPRGILLFGPPGCSKTLLARAVAGESGLNFLAVKGPELYSKYVGESEKALATLFKRARASSPAIIFFDEIDGLVTSRSAEGTGGVDVSDRVLSQLLQELDGLQTNDQKPVIVIAATNRPDSIDSALLRPGRFDRLLFVPPPGDAATREAIFRVHTRKMPLHSDVDTNVLAQRAAGYTGADIAAICQQAGYLQLEQDIHATSVSMEHFLRALDQTPASASSAAATELYESFRRQCL